MTSASDRFATQARIALIFLFAGISVFAQTAQMSSPPGSTFSSITTVFQWNFVSGADQYWLDVGSTVAEGDYVAGPTTNNAVIVNVLPCDGRPIYVQLWTHYAGNWLTPQRYTYTAESGCSALGAPANGANFPGTTVI